MKTFITGATGFIGRHVVKRLAQTGHELHCLIRATSDLGELRRQGVTLFTGDVTDKDSILAGIQGCERVINLANAYSYWEPDKRTYEAVNVRGTRNVMECALAAKVSKVVHVSSVVIYGKPEQSPFSEESPIGQCRFSRYAQTKYEGDLIAWDLHEKKNLPLVMIYPGAVMGPGDPKATGKYIKDMIGRRLPATLYLDSRLTFVHVRDVAEVIVRALEKEGNVGEKYFACGQQLSFREINAMIKEIAGVPLPKLTLPDWLVKVNAALLTAIADLIKKPPLWGLSVDQINTMRVGFIADGSKAARELGIIYTPIRVAIEEAIASYRSPDPDHHK